jgi:glycosyltransferase involved in cell wall biosynthesis
MVARVDPMKDHAAFLAAATELVAGGSAAAFALIGAGTERLDIPPALADRLHALGERDDVAELLPALDLMALPSAYGEGFPNAVGEAMACGVPCVASAVGDAAAIIADTGAIVPPRDPRALAAAIAELLSRGPDGLAVLGAAARQRVVLRYSLAAVVERYQRIYEEVAADSPAPSAV